MNAQSSSDERVLCNVSHEALWNSQLSGVDNTITLQDISLILWLRIIDRLVLFVTHINFGRLRTFLSKSENFSKLITRKSDEISKFWNHHEIELKKMVLEIQVQISVVLSRVAPEVTAFILENPFTTEPPKSKSTIEKKPRRYIYMMITEKKTPNLGRHWKKNTHSTFFLKRAHNELRRSLRYQNDRHNL